MKINKELIKAAILDGLKQDLDAIIQAADAAHQGAMHEDAIGKSKYDTHGLELSYLAGSQFERARALEGQITLLKQTNFRDFGEHDSIDVGALIEWDAPIQGARHCFLSNLGAGIKLSIAGQFIQVLSPESDLGQEMLGLMPGDRVALKDRKLAFSIVSIS